MRLPKSRGPKKSTVRVLQSTYVSSSGADPKAGLDVFADNHADFAAVSPRSFYIAVIRISRLLQQVSPVPVPIRAIIALRQSGAMLR